MKDWIKRIFGTKCNAYAVLLFDGHLHYWSGNVFTTKDNAKRWAKKFAKESESIKVRDIVGVHTKNVFCFVNTELNPEQKKYAEEIERQMAEQRGEGNG